MWYKGKEEILKQLETSSKGITNSEANKRLKEEGLNRIPTGKKNTIWNIIIEQLKNPIIFILFFSAIFSIITQSKADAIFIFVVIGINTIIGTYQEWSSEKSAEKLQNMIKIRTKVLRDGKIEEIDSENIVVGDIIELESGNKVPADLRLIDVKNLSIDESVLTGESKPKNKLDITLPKETELAERDNIAFAGSIVTKGRGRGVVIATGQYTEFGKVAENVLLSEDSKTPLVIVKKLNAVESLGSCNVIATDKTGTLTANEQTAKKIVLPNDSVASIKGIGYNDIGEIRCDEKDKTQIKEIVKMGYVNNEARLEYDGKQWKHSGDAIDTAFLALGMKIPIKQQFDIKSMIHYESQLKYSAVVFEENNEYVVTIKGAPEKVLEFCKYINEKEKINKDKILNQNIQLAEEGYRVIAIAQSKIHKRNFETKELEEKDLKDMIFLGLIGFVDPIREGVTEAVESCKKAGIETIMITGDQKNTAEAIAKRIGITKVYSRATPMEKLEIVKKLKEEGKMVAVTGDGVNDTPALKSANIGVAIGSGTDIAKETGNMIITDDNFSSIVNGVEEGRRAYNNIRKVIYLLLSTGLSEIILFVLAMIFNFPISYLLTLMVLMENIHIFNCRSERISAFKISGQNNKFLIFSILITCLIQIIVVRSDILSNILRLKTIPLEFAGGLVVFSIPLIIIMEVYKKFVNK